MRPVDLQTRGSSLPPLVRCDVKVKVDDSSLGCARQASWNADRGEFTLWKERPTFEKHSLIFLDCFEYDCSHHIFLGTKHWGEVYATPRTIA